MAQYAADCAPARTILVEHDITFDLYEQLARDDADWDLHRELRLWRDFETKAWRGVNCVVTMSQKDQALVKTARAVVLPNGVDLDRFRVAAREPELRRLLFVGSFSHKPNMIALEFFLREVWPRLPRATLHVIAGRIYREYFSGILRHGTFTWTWRKRVSTCMDLFRMCGLPMNARRS